jgi:o-succinylbenzoate synthase
MQILAWRLIPYSLPFRRPWRTHRETLTRRHGWLVQLISGSGLQGLGDCAPLISAGTESAVEAEHWLQRQLSELQQQTPLTALDSLPVASETPAARHAVETALLDLVSQAGGLSLRHWFSPEADDRIAVNGAAGALDRTALQRVLPLMEQGFRVIKLKVGLDRVDQEVELLQRLTETLPADIHLRLDANGAWNRPQADRFLHQAAELPIESLEEPLAKPDPRQLAALQAETEITLALDESLPQMQLTQLLEHPPVKRLILKPCVLGGLLPTRRLAADAAAAGLESLITSSLESSVGLHAAAQLAAALPQAVHGLATSDWFTRDLAQPPLIRDGRLQLPDSPGLGVRLYSDLTPPDEPD